MIGSFTRFSTITNKIVQMTNMASSPSTGGESQGYFWPPKVSASSNGMQAAAISTAPR